MFEVFVESHAVSALAQDAGQGRLAHLDRLPAHVGAVKLQEVEGDALTRWRTKEAGKTRQGDLVQLLLKSNRLRLCPVVQQERGAIGESA